MPIITAQWLRDHNACAGQVALFEREFPHGCELISSEIRRAGDAGLFLYWFADHALSEDGQALFAELTQAKRSALEEAQRSTKAKHAVALVEDRAKASKAITAERAPHERAYKTACVQALVEAGRRYGWVV